MKKTSLMATITATLISGAAIAEDIQLPEPSKEGGKPLMNALAERKTSREFAETAIPEQKLSDMLWAAYGINRPEEGKRTAPSALNRQEIDLYAIMESGAYLYNASSNKLVQVTTEDIRAKSGFGEFANKAPLTFVFVINKARQRMSDPMASSTTGAVDSGFIGQNIYLFCASEEMNAVFFATLNKDSLASSLKLSKGDTVLYGQTVGFPPEEK